MLDHTAGSTLQTRDTKRMRTVKTLLRGDVEVCEDQLIRMAEPLFGFEHLDEYLIYQTQDGPLSWLQSTQDVNTAFCVLRPFAVGLDPDIEVGTRDISDLGCECLDEIVVYTLVVLMKDAGKSTTNLRAPILVCTKTNLAKQVILEDPALDLRYPLARIAAPRR